MTTQSNGNSITIQGRIVWVTGDLFTGRQKKDFTTNQPVIGPDGNPKMEYGFGLAIPKIDPQTQQNTAEYVKIWEALHREALTLFPGGQLPPDFAMKLKDGDGVDNKGIPFSKREGYANHVVIACTTQIAIKYFIYEGGNNIVVNTGIKNGDYVNVQLNIKAHPAVGNMKAGLYLNPGAVQLIQSGAAIINTPSGDQIFGQTAPGYNGQVVADTAPQMPQQAPVVPQQPAMPQQAPVAQPHYGVLPNTMQPPVAPVVPQQPVQPVAQIPQQPLHPPVTPTPQVNGYAPPVAPSNGLPQAVPGMPQALLQPVAPQAVPGMPTMP